MSERAPHQDRRKPEGITRWVCGCQAPPVLLGTQDPSGTIHVKARDRYWHIVGLVKTACPRCGAEHVLASTSANGASSTFGLTRS